jgi:hypothetical protein
MSNLNEAKLAPSPVAYNSGSDMNRDILGVYPEEIAAGIREYPVAPEEAYRPRYIIRIEQLDFGYALNIGCKGFAFETKERMLANLDAYLSDPVAAENNWNKTKTLPV